MWEKVKAFHYGSVTVVFAHFLGWLAVAEELLAQFPDIANSVGLAQYVPPIWMGKYTAAIAVCTLLARFRSLQHKDDPHA